MATEKTCRTCNHWVTLKGSPKTGVCRCSVEIDEWSAASDLEDMPGMYSRCGLNTNGNFSCVLHKPKKD